MEEKLYNHFGCGPDDLCGSFCILLQESLFAHLTTLALAYRCDNLGAFLRQGEHKLSCLGLVGQLGDCLCQDEHKLFCLGFCLLDPSVPALSNYAGLVEMVERWACFLEPKQLMVR